MSEGKIILPPKFARITLNAIPKITMKIASVETVPLVIRECTELGRWWVGYGYYGSRGENLIARFIMVRDPVTCLTTYYFWTDKKKGDGRKGKVMPIVRQFKLQYLVTAAYVIDHLSSSAVSRGLLARHGLHVSRFDRPHYR